MPIPFHISSVLVAEEATKKRSATPFFLARSLKINSAIGLRQMLPWQTNMILHFLSAFISLCCKSSLVHYFEQYITNDLLIISRISMTIIKDIDKVPHQKTFFTISTETTVMQIDIIVAIRESSVADMISSPPNYYRIIFIILSATLLTMGTQTVFPHCL